MEPAADGLVDVATRTSWKAIFVAALWLMIGGPLLAGGAAILASEVPRAIQAGAVKEPGIVFGLGPGLVLAGWLIAATGVRRIVAAFRSGYGLRAGPAGVSIRLPGGPTLASALLSPRLAAWDLKWDEIVEVHPFHISVNGIPTGSYVVFTTKAAGEIQVPTVYFAGSAEEIVGRIGAARKPGS